MSENSSASGAGQGGAGVGPVAGGPAGAGAKPGAARDDSPEAREQLARRLTKARSMILVTHDRPDGDGLGSMVALARAARLRGKTCRLAAADPTPKRYTFLMEGESPLDAQAFAAASAAAEVDTIVVLDTCAFSQLEAFTPILRAARPKVIVVDHHITRDDVGAVRWCDVHAAAVGVMVTELLQRLSWPVDLPGARAAMAAICSDTGWLRFANTDSRALAAVGHWLEAGVDPSELYRRLYENDRPQRLALLGRALTGMQLHLGGSLAMMTVRQEDFAETGATPEETENLINESLRIGSVEVAAMLVEHNAVTRVSLRSKGPAGNVAPGAPAAVAPPPVDVSAVAQRFGGGGHARSAGFRLPEPLPQVAEKLLEALTDVLGG